MIRITFVLMVFLLINRSGHSQLTRPDAEKCSALYTSGKEAFYSEDYKKAVIDLQKAYSCDATFENIEGMLAYSYYKSREYNQTIRFATKALKRNPNDMVALQARGWSYYALSAFDSCLRDLKQPGIEKESNFYNHLCIASSCFEMGDYTCSYQESEKGIRLNPEDIRLQFLKGSAALKLDHAEEAVGILQQVIKKWNDRPLPYLYLGMALYKTDQVEEAAYYLDLAKSNKFNIRLSASEQEEALFYHGAASFHTKQYEKAISSISTVYSTDTVNLQYLQLLSYSYLEMGHPAKAKEYLERGYRHFPSEGIFDYGLGYYYTSNKNYPLAKDYLRGALRKLTTVTDTSAFLKNLADAFLQLMDTSLALETAAAMVKYHPGESYGYNTRLGILLDQPAPDYPRILPDLNTLVNLKNIQPEESAFYLALKADIERRNGMLPKSLESINKAIRLSEKEAYKALRAIIVFETESKKLQGKRITNPALQQNILQDITPLLEHAEKKQEAALLMATMLAKLGKREEACQLVEKHALETAYPGRGLLEKLCSKNGKDNEGPDFDFRIRDEKGYLLRLN